MTLVLNSWAGENYVELCRVIIHLCERRENNPPLLFSNGCEINQWHLPSSSNVVCLFSLEGFQWFSCLEEIKKCPRGN